MAMVDHTQKKLFMESIMCHHALIANVWFFPLGYTHQSHVVPLYIRGALHVRWKSGDPCLLDWCDEKAGEEQFLPMTCILMQCFFHGSSLSP